jgi:hypothetical protein
VRRTTFALVLLLAGCLLSTLREVRQAPTLFPSTPAIDEVAARSDKRFAELKRVLPPAGTVGYLSQVDPSGLADHFPSAISDYFLTQYALAPLVVVPSIHPPIVVGNFFSREPQVRPGDVDSALRLTRDFGDGVLLFERERR